MKNIILAISRDGQIRGAIAEEDFNGAECAWPNGFAWLTDAGISFDQTDLCCVCSEQRAAMLEYYRPYVTEDARTQRWVFTDAELRQPEGCKASDEFEASLSGMFDPPCEVAILVCRNGQHTNRFADGTAGIPGEWAAAVDDVEYYHDPRSNRWAGEWRDVVTDGRGGFVRFVDPVKLDPMLPVGDTCSRTVKGEARAKFVAECLLGHSQWFAVMPFPDDEWCIFTKDENRALLSSLCIDAERNEQAAKRSETELLEALKVAEAMLRPLVSKMPIRTHFSEHNALENTICAAIRKAANRTND